METLIACDNPAVSRRLRQALVQYGQECPITNVLSVQETLQSIKDNSRCPDLVLHVVSADRNGALEQLKQLRQHFSAWLVAIGPGDDSRHILDAVHAGADDYLDEAGDLGQQLEGFLQRSQADLASCKLGRVILVTSASGGCGASVIGSNLAASIAQDLGTCGLLDFDLLKGDQASLFGIKPRHSIADLCRNAGALDMNMLEQSLAKHECGVQLLAAPKAIPEVACVTSEGLRQVVQIARSVFPALVVDIGHWSDRWGTGLLESADARILAFRSDFTSLRNLHRVLEHWDQARIDGKRTLVVANRHGQKCELPLSKVEGVVQRSVAHVVPNDPQGVNLSVNCGKPIVLEAPKSAVGRSLASLAAKVRDEATVVREREAKPSLFHLLRTEFARRTSGVLFCH